MMKFFSRFRKDESGATAIEYGLIAAFMAVALIALMPTITGGLSDAFDNIGENLSSTPSPT